MHVMRARLSVALRPSWSVGGMMRANVGIEQHAEDSRLRISREKLHKLGALSKLEIPTEPAPQRVLQIDLEKMYNLFDMLHQGACMRANLACFIGLSLLLNDCEIACFCGVQ